MMRTFAIIAGAAVMALSASAASADNARVKPTVKKHAAAVQKRSPLEAARNLDSRASADDRPVIYGHPPAQPAQ